MTSGAVGEAPDVYWLLRAARFLRVPPWDLAERRSVWTDLALATERAELAARDWQGPVTGDDD